MTNQLPTLPDQAETLHRRASQENKHPRKFRFPKGTPFWQRVLKMPSGCWEWQGARNDRNYGCYYPHMGEKHLAHRYAYRLAHGEFDTTLDVLHKCDNPPCCNPDHLFLGTHQDNMIDRQNKGRTRTGCLRGSANPSASFTDDEVRSIRARVANGETRTTIANEYGVSLSTISLITCRKHYREVL